MNANKIKRGLAASVLVISAVFITMNMNACGKKSNSGSGPAGPQYPYQPGTPTCPGCPTNTSLISNAIGQHNPNTITIGLQIYAAAAAGGGYQSSVAANGWLWVGPGVGSINCPINPGTYTLATIQPGTLGYNDIRNLRLQGSGPSGQVVLTVGPNSGAYITNAVPDVTYNGMVFQDYLEGNVLIETINGMPCQPLYPYYVN